MQLQFANPLASFAGGQLMGEQAAQIQQAGVERARANALLALMQQHGQGVFQGDQNALNALAAAGFADEAMGFRERHHGMEVQNRQLGQTDRRLDQDDQRLAFDREEFEFRRQQARQETEILLQQMQIEGREAELAQAAEADKRGALALAEIANSSPEDYARLAPQIFEMMGEEPVPQEDLAPFLAQAAGQHEAVQEALGRMRGGVEPEPTTGMRNFDFLTSLGLPQEEAIPRAFSGGVTVNTGDQVDGRPLVGAPPAGIQRVWDEEAQTWRDTAIPGGTEDTTAQQESRRSTQDTLTSVVTNAATRALEGVRERMFGGLAGQVAARLPSTPNAEVQRQVEVLRSNATIEALNAMRRESPTGGALGNVTEREGAMLAARAGALDPASPEFERDLADYTRVLLQTIHGFEEGQRIFEEQFGGQAEGFQPVEQTGGLVAEVRTITSQDDAVAWVERNRERLDEIPAAEKERLLRILEGN